MYLCRMVRHSVIESDENDAALDLAYVVLVFITFLPTLILPAFYVRWILIGNRCFHGPVMAGPPLVTPEGPRVQLDSGTSWESQEFNPRTSSVLRSPW